MVNMVTYQLIDPLSLHAISQANRTDILLTLLLFYFVCVHLELFDFFLGQTLLGFFLSFNGLLSISYLILEKLYFVQ